LGVLGLVAFVLVLINSPTYIIPPLNPSNPVVAYIIDYGYHSRLLLPDGNGGLIHYTYGDWRYFALNEQDLSDGLAALFVPTPSTLGRRRFDSIAQFRQGLGSQWQDAHLSFVVAEADVARLLRSLDERFEENIDTRVVNPRNNLAFVRGDRDYTLFHNSNHELVRWLEQLDCRVEGFVTWPNFQVKQPRE
jgi:hypothetical protein